MSEGNVKEVRKEGEWYHVKGRVGGRDVDVHVPSPTVDGMDRKKAMDVFKRSVERIAEAT